MDGSAQISTDARPDDSNESFDRTTLFRRRRPLFWLALAFCLGIALDSALAPALASVGGFFLAASFAAAALIFARAPQSAVPRSGAKFSATAFVLTASAGMLLHALLSRIPAADDVSRQTSALPSFVTLRGTIVETNRAQPNRSPAWTLSVDALGSDATALAPASGRVRVSLPVAEDLSAIAEGDRVVFRALLESPPEVTLPGSFDYGAFLQNSGIRRVGSLFPASVQHLSPPGWWRVDVHLRRASTTLAQRVEALLSHEPSQAALLNALLFGRRERVDVSDRESFAVSGVAHLLAISGLQIQFLAFLLWRGATRLGISRRRSALMVLVLSLAYCALSGADAPIVRATVMITLYLAATILYRQPDPLNTLGASALVILAASPSELFNAGFQLSFLAVFSLITILPVLNDTWTALWKIHRPTLIGNAVAATPPILFGRPLALSADPLRHALFVSLAAWIGTAPVVAWHMGRFATLSLLINLLAVPLGSICMISGLLMLALSTVSTTLASAAGTVTAFFLLLLQKLTSFFASLPFASIDLPAPSLPIVAVYSAILIWLWVQRERLQSFFRVCALLLSCVLLLNASLLFPDSPPASSVTVLDLKSGRSALVESSAGGAAMIDAGGLGSGQRIAEMLRRRGVGRLALLVISADEPEAIDGALDLLKHVPAARVILPRDSSPSTTRRELERYLTSRDIPYSSPDTTQALQGPGNIRWEFLDDGNPPQQPPGAQTAIAVRVTLPGTRMLFVDARSEAALQRLLARRESDFFSADVLRLSTGSGARWPASITRLVRESRCRAVIAGTSTDPEETAGIDIAAVTEAQGVKLLSPHREGSLRVQADSATIQSFRAGKWSAVP